MPDPSATLAELLADHDRVGVTGGPKVGKTTICMGVDDRVVVNTDATKDMPWEDQPHEIIRMLKGLDRYLIEGVQVPRALRKGLELDALLVLSKPHEERTPRQEGMAKGVETVLADWERGNKDGKTKVVRL